MPPVHLISFPLQILHQNYGFYLTVSLFVFQNALNCWIAACIYVVTLLVSGQQFYANSRTTA